MAELMNTVVLVWGRYLELLQCRTYFSLNGFIRQSVPTSKIDQTGVRLPPVIGTQNLPILQDFHPNPWLLISVSRCLKQNKNKTCGRHIMTDKPT